MISELGGQITGVAAALAKRRQMLGFTPGEVDARAGFARGNVVGWESCGGPKTASLLARWATALGLVLTARDLPAAAPLIYEASHDGF